MKAVNKKKSLGIASLCLLALPLSAGAGEGAGGKEGHGGVSIVCREPSPLPKKGKIVKAQLLDLFEARENGIRITPSKAHPMAQAMRVSGRLLRDSSGDLRTFARLLAAELPAVISSVQMLRPETGLPLIDDSFPKLYEKGCEFEQLARYNANHTIDVDEEIFRAMSPTDQAALYVHEAVYKIARDRRGETNSVNSREVTGRIFADDPQVATNLWPGSVWDRKKTFGHYTCTANYANGQSMTLGSAGYRKMCFPNSNKLCFHGFFLDSKNEGVEDVTLPWIMVSRDGEAIAEGISLKVEWPTSAIQSIKCYGP